MTVDPTTPATHITPAEPKPNSLQRIFGVLFSPGPTFESIARRPDWVVPLLIFVVLSLVGGVLIAQHVNFDAMAREAMEMNPQMSKVPADRVDTIVRFTAATMKVSAYASPLLTIIILAIAAVALLVSFRMFGGAGTFAQAFSVTIYAWYPRLIKSVLAIIVVLSKKSVSVFDLQNPIRSNLGFLFDPKTQPVQFALGSSLDLFSLWSLALLIIGFAIVSRLPRMRSAMIVIVLWLVVNCLALIGPAVQAVRMRS